jgi:hypothetical protein
MKKIFSVLALFLSLQTFAQKVDVDDNDMITVDGVKYAKIERDGCGFAQNCQFKVYDTTGKLQIVIKFEDYNDPTKAQASNPKGRVTYFEFVFLESKQKAETDAVGIKSIKVAKFIVKNELFLNGMLNPTAVDNFVLVNEPSFSKRKLLVN